MERTRIIAIAVLIVGGGLALHVAPAARNQAHRSSRVRATFRPYMPTRGERK